MVAYSTANMLGANLQLVYTPSTTLVPYAGGSDPGYAVGQKTQGTDGSVWTYVKASSSISQYNWVGIDENFQAAPLTKAMADAGWIIGVAQVAIASGSYGWVCTQGANVTGGVLASCAADVTLYTSGTAGYLDDAATTQTKIDGVVLVTANTLTQATNLEVLLTFPRSDTF